MALRGSLSDFSLPDVFQLIQLSRKTGVLRIHEGDAEGSVWFRDGEVFFAQSNWHRELLGHRLVASGRITTAALAKALEIRRNEPVGARRLGQILVDEGYITQSVLEAFVQEQIQDTIFDLMRWDTGAFDFEVLPETVDEDIGLTVSIENIVMEGSRRIEEWNRIRKKVPSTDMVFKMATAPGEGTFEIALKPTEWNLLLKLDGTRSVGALASAVGKTDFEVARIIYGLFSAGLLEVASDEEVARLKAEQIERVRRRAEAAAAVSEPEPEAGPEATAAEVEPELESQPEPEPEFEALLEVSVPEVEASAGPETEPISGPVIEEWAIGQPQPAASTIGAEPQFEPELEAASESAPEVAPGLVAEAEAPPESGPGAGPQPEGLSGVPEEESATALPAAAWETVAAAAVAAVEWQQSVADGHPGEAEVAEPVLTEEPAVEEPQPAVEYVAEEQQPPAEAFTYDEYREVEPEPPASDSAPSLELETAPAVGELASVPGPEEPLAVEARPDEIAIFDRMVEQALHADEPQAEPAVEPVRAPEAGAGPEPTAGFLRTGDFEADLRSIGLGELPPELLEAQRVSSLPEQHPEPEAPEPIILSTDAFLQDLEVDVSLVSGLGDEIAALTGGSGSARTRPVAQVAWVPETDGAPIIKRDSSVDAALVRSIIDGIEKL